MARTTTTETPRPVWNGAELKKIRVKRGVSIKQLADALGQPPGTIYRWEKNEASPQADSVIALAIRLGNVDPVSFFDTDAYRRYLNELEGGISASPVMVDDKDTGARVFVKHGHESGGPRATPSPAKSPQRHEAKRPSDTKRVRPK